MIIISKMLILCYTCGIFESNAKMNFTKSLKSLRRYWHVYAMSFPCPQCVFTKSLKFLRCYWHVYAMSLAWPSIYSGTLNAGEPCRKPKLFSKIGLATEQRRAIDLSCRACGAGAWALGLDSRLGTPASLPSFFPTSDFIRRETKVVSGCHLAILC